MSTEANERRDDGSQPVHSDWSHRVGGLTGVTALIRALNVDPAVVLDSAGIACDALDHPDNRIDYGAFGRLLQDSSKRARYAHFGLTAGRMWHLEDLGLLGELVRHSPTVGEALEMLRLYQHLNGGGGLLFTARHGALSELGYAIYYPGIAGVDQIYDFTLATLVNIMRELCGPGWIPTQVLIPHARPEDPVHYRNLFKVVPQFDSEVCALRFSAHWLDHRVEGADPERRKQALAMAYDKDDPDLLQQVHRALRSVLLNGKSSGNEVADALSMHRRTLNRRLQECGTTFQHVLDETRCEAARQLLCYSKVALDDIAASLAYAGVSPFMRSFRRWTGLTPGRLRRLGLQRAHDFAASMNDPSNHTPAMEHPTGRVARHPGAAVRERVAKAAPARPKETLYANFMLPIGMRHSATGSRARGIPLHSMYPAHGATSD